MIFDEVTLRKLNALTLVASRVRAGRMRGDRRSSKRGSSIEFADFRNYVPGDDLRRLDWNIYARLDKPFIKLFEDEEDLAVYILLDGSKSMDWGQADGHKFTFGRRLAGALAAIALNSGDALRFELLPGGTIFGPARGSRQVLRLLQTLEAQVPGGLTSLNDGLLQFSMAAVRAGLVFLISDLLDPAGYQQGLNQLLARGHQVVLLHLLAADEIDPSLSGDLRLVDVEFEAAQEVSLDSAVLQGYRRQLERWQAEIRAFCRARGVSYVFSSTDAAWDQFVLRQLRQEGIVR